VARLTEAKRHRLPDRLFAIPEKRSYPIYDVEHARLALGMVSKYGTPEEQAQVRSAVARRFPGLGKTRFSKLQKGQP
jgi:hypothetical protein